MNELIRPSKQPSVYRFMNITLFVMHGMLTHNTYHIIHEWDGGPVLIQTLFELTFPRALARHLGTTDKE